LFSGCYSLDPCTSVALREAGVKSEKEKKVFILEVLLNHGWKSPRPSSPSGKDGATRVQIGL
jgi:hypothetical protein